MRVTIVCLLAASLCVAYTLPIRTPAEPGTRAGVAGLAVMSVDLGMEFMKVAIVKPGVPMEIALNKDSRRKTPVVVAFDREDRLFGDAAVVKMVRYPKAAYQYLQDVLGKTRDNPGVARFERRFPYYDIEEDPDRKTVLFKHSEDTVYSPEELMAMILETAKETATEFAEQPVTDAVITVPPFFNQAERRAMLRAADIAGVKVLQLMNDNTAVALNYGVFRRKAFNQTAVHYMFFDMGAGSTTATIVAYQLVKAKNAATGILETNPQLTIKGVGYDRTLGGIDFQFRLRDHLAKLFNGQKKTKLDVTQNARSMAKLFKEAGRVKNVLSANNDHYSQVEGLLDEQDFRAKVSRADFQEMCADLFGRIAKPVEDALKSSQITWDEISEVILMGGSTRMPKVKEILMESTGRTELGKSINTDEAAAMGAVYQAAHLSKGFRVKKFNIKDATLFPIQVEFDRVKSGEDGGADIQKTVRRTLFGRMNAFPQKKVMTFNKHVKDFSFSVNYADLSFMPEQELKEFGATHLQKVSLSGVETIYDKHKEGTENKGVKAHFRMDDSGILSLDKVESVFERPPDAEPEAQEESTLQKLGSFFFGSSDKDGEQKEEDGTPEEVKEEIKAEKEEGQAEKEKEEKGEKKAEEKPKEQKEKAEKAKPEKKPEAKEKKQEKEEKEEKKKEESKDEAKEEEKETPKEEKKNGSKDEKKNGKAKKDKKESKDKKDKKGDEKSENGDSDKKDKKNGKGEEKSEEKVEEKKPAKPTVIREDVTVETAVLDLADPSEDDIKISKKKISDLRKRDQEKRQLEAAKNDLESFIIEAQDRLYQEQYEAASTEEERTNMREQLSAASDWLYEQDDNTDKKSYEDKLAELKKLMGPLYGRVKEHEERPRALEALRTVFNYSQHFLVTMKNFTGEDLAFTQVEYDTLSKLINDTKKWNKTMSADQAKTPLTEKPKMLVEDIARKINDLDREVKYLINKAKVFRPKEKKKEKKNNETKTEEKIEKNNGEKEESKEESKEEVKEKEFKIPETEANEDTKDTKPKEKEAEKEEEQEPLQLEEGNTEEPETKQEKEKTEKETKGDKKTGHDPGDEL